MMMMMMMTLVVVKMIMDSYRKDCAVIVKTIRTISSRLYFGANWKDNNDKIGQFHHRNPRVIVIWNCFESVPANSFSTDAKKVIATKQCSKLISNRD